MVIGHCFGRHDVNIPKAGQTTQEYQAKNCGINEKVQLYNVYNILRIYMGRGVSSPVIIYRGKIQAGWSLAVAPLTNAICDAGFGYALYSLVRWNSSVEHFHCVGKSVARNDSHTIIVRWKTRAKLLKNGYCLA
jgi:hypothetical protein